jgi:glutamate--cysteine ligase
LALIRNFRRESWVLLYLFGASPVVDESFVAGTDHPLEKLAPQTLGLPYSTSLRMGRLGYQSAAQNHIRASFNCLESYTASLERALTEPYPDYETIGIQDAQGQYQQLNTTLLQIENEFYSTIRPKRVVQSGERPLKALRERGIQYIEVRCMDVNPFSPVGIDAATMRFLDLFLLRCLRRASPPDSPEEHAIMSENQVRVAHQGRQPDLMLQHPLGGSRSLTDWAIEIVSDCAQIAQELDACLCKPGRIRHKERSYQAAIDTIQARLNDPSLLPSSQILAQLAQEDLSFIQLGLHQAQSQSNYWNQQIFTPEHEAYFKQLAQDSLKAQHQLEQDERNGSTKFDNFEAFRQHYIGQPFDAK